MASPNALTLDRLRREGYAAGVVERFIAGAGENGQGIRVDFLGCIDIIAVKPGVPVLAVQCTSLAHVGDRLAKARGKPELRTWLAAGAVFQVWGWAKRPEGWRVRIVEVQAGDLADVVLEAPPRKRRRSRWQAPDLFGG